MAYKALYRSYRPSSFEAVIGQEHIIKTLKNALISKKTSHAYIFSGPRGIGKTTIARILAKAINCENPQDGEPCNKCAACRLINNNETPDIIEIDAASNNGVEEIRNVLEKVNFLPSVLKHKVYIIDEVHMLSLSAFNALLKTLEEPPVHVMFILATTEPHKIPATIISRCQRFDFKPLTPKEIKTNLVSIAHKEKIDIEDAAIDTIAEASEGGMRDAIGILDQVNAYSTKTITIEDVNNVTGSISNQKLIELMQALNDGLSADAVALTNELIGLGKEVSRLTQSLLQICRDILFYQNTESNFEGKIIFEDVAFKMLCNSINKKKVFYFIEVLSDVQNKIKYSLSQKIFLEVGIMKMASSTPEDYSNNTAVTSEAGTVVYADGLEEKVNGLENHLNKIKTELIRLNLNEFKEETKTKFDILQSLEEKIENLNNKEVVSADNITVDNSELEESIKFVLSKLDELTTKVNDLPALEDKQDVDNDQLVELQNQINELKSSFESFKKDFVDVENALSELILNTPVEPVEMDIQKRDNPYNQVIQDVVTIQNQYEESIQEEKAELEPISEQGQESVIEEEPITEELEFVEEVEKEQDETIEELEFIEEELQEEVINEPEVVEEIKDEPIQEEMVEEPQVEPVEELKPQQVNLFDLFEELQEEQTESAKEPAEEVEIPNEMARPIDDFFTNPVFFDKPLVEEPQPQQVESVDVVEETITNKPEPVEEKVEDEQPILIFENEELPKPDEYELNCDADLLDKYLEFLALTRNTGTIEYTNCVVDTVKQLDAMKLDVEKFSKDKANGVFLTNDDLKASANRAIKSFLSAMMNGNAMKVSNKDVAIGVLIAENKEMIQAYRKAAEPEKVVEFAVPNPIEEKPVVEEIKDEPIQEEMVEETQAVEEQIQEEVTEEVVEEPTLEVVEQPIVEEVYTESTIQEQEEPLEEIVQEENIEEIEEETEEPQAEMAEEVVEEPQKEVVEEKPVETTPTFNLDSLVIKEEEKVEKPAEPQYVHKTILDTTPQKVVAVEDDNPYAIEKIEMIMHDSRSEISREERKIILNKWGQLEDRVNMALAPVARFLREGQPVVNGNNCIIITYPNAMLCNHIMGEKQHFEAKQILKLTFGKEYDFIALPENVWNDKRNEYRGQYQMGMRFPKLTPINNPELRIIKKSFVDEQSESYKQAVDLFGEDLIKKDEE